MYCWVYNIYWPKSMTVTAQIGGWMAQHSEKVSVFHWNYVSINLKYILIN